MIRLFVGISLPEALRERLAGLASGLPGARWIQPENLHMTLCFLGQVEEHQLDDIHLALSAIDRPAFDYSLSSIETFGRGRQVHTLWARVDGGASLITLQAKIEQAMRGLAIPVDNRKFTPHITLARIKGASPVRVAEWLETRGGLAEGPVSVQSFALFRSHLGAGSPYYERLCDYPLKAE